MTREEQLANMLSEIGLERGVAIGQLADDLVRLSLPSFIDAQAFRAALLNALEYQLRAQVETTIAELRRRFGAASPETNRPPSPKSASASRLSTSRPEPLPSQPVAAPAEPAGRVTEPDLPDDATIHWESGQGPTLA